MRLIVPLFLFIVGFGFLAGELPCSEAYRAGKNRPTAETSSDWRRTADGWQRASDWTLAVKRETPALHPAVVGGFQVLLVLTVALALDLCCHAEKAGRDGKERQAEVPGVKHAGSHEEQRSPTPPSPETAASYPAVPSRDAGISSRNSRIR